MDKFALKSEQERRDVFQEAASRRDIADIIVEKDFWVCWILKRLFSSPTLSPYLTFKGGTSLSKAYGLIERFSEDIDLTISRDAPFLADGKNPMDEDIFGKERERRIEVLKTNAQQFVDRIVLPALTKDIEAMLGKASQWNIVLDIEDPDKQTILFHYPRVLNYGRGYGMGRYGVGLFGEGEIGYIHPHIKLEFGARGETEPHESRSITPYIAETFPELFEAPSYDVSVLGAERTFWEKATILHALYHGSKMRDRMSRHYYDTYMLTQKGIADKAMANPALLKQVVRNKSLLFRDTKASYETAVPGGFKLLPATEQFSVLQKDYEKMTEMFIGEYPDFKTIMESIETIERRINQTKNG